MLGLWSPTPAGRQDFVARSAHGGLEMVHLGRSTVHMAVWLCRLFLSAGLDGGGWTGVGWVGSAIPLPVLITSYLPARPSNRCWTAWLPGGWDAAGVGEAGPFGGGEGG